MSKYILRCFGLVSSITGVGLLVGLFLLPIVILKMLLDVVDSDYSFLP